MKSSRLISMFLVAALVGATMSCAADSDSADHSFGPSFKSGSQKKLAKCAVLGYAYAGSTIGPRGGTISAGKHSLVIPAGALTRSVFISITMNRDTTANVSLQPEGLQFAPGKPATLTLDYKHCSIVNPVQVAYTTEQLQIIQLLPSIDNKSRKNVSTSLQHFSRYAVAY
jgi:hypothetical protein